MQKIRRRLLGYLIIPALAASAACAPPLAEHAGEAGMLAAPETAKRYLRSAPPAVFSADALSAPELPNSEPAIDPLQKYDLPALVDLALQNHPETRVSWEEAKAAAARLERNRSLWYPTLTAMALGQYYKMSIPIPQSVLVSRGYNVAGSLELAWTLFDFGRREALIDASAERLSAAGFALDRKHQEIAYRVAQGFFNYQAALAKVAATGQTLEAAKTSASSVQAKIGKGLATRPELLLAIQEQARANYELQDAKGAVMQAQADLSSSIGVSPDQTLKFVDMSQLPLPAGLEPSVEKIVDQSLEDHPDLQARLAELRAREAELKKARADFWPKLSLKGNVGNNYWGNIHTSPPSSEIYSSSNVVGAAMLNFEWNLFDGFERRNAVNEMQARKQAAQAQLEALRLEIVRDIWKAYADTKTALEKRQFALDLLRAAEESYNAAQESYTQGFSTVVELLSAQKDLAHARYVEIDSRAGLLKSAAHLAFASGRPAENNETEAQDGR